MKYEDIKQGDWVRIKKGADVKSTHPQHKRFQTKRANVVEVHMKLPAFAGFEDHPPRPAQITWAGTGGYWCDVDVSCVEAVVPQPAKKKSKLPRACRPTTK